MMALILFKNICVGIYFTHGKLWLGTGLNNNMKINNLRGVKFYFSYKNIQKSKFNHNIISIIMSAYFFLFKSLES